MVCRPIAVLALLAAAPAAAVAAVPTPTVTVAEAMLGAAAADQGTDPVLIDWRMLGSLDLNSGKAPPALAALNGKLVKLASFIVPLEDDMQQADEFLLVPYFGACVHTPPPPPNQMVYVKMQGRKTVKIGWWDPVMFEGILHLKQVESPYGASYFEMEGIKSAPYKPAAK